MSGLNARAIGNNYVYYVPGNLVNIVDAIGPDVVKYFEDFIDRAAASDAITGWTMTLVEGGNGDTTVTRTGGSGGHLLITTDDAENDGVNGQVTAGESFKLAAGNQCGFAIRFKASEATQSDILAGLCITDTDLLGGVTHGVYMEKLDASTGISCVTEKDSTETQTDNCGTFAADTWTVWAWWFNGTKVFFMIDGEIVATHTATIPNDEELTPSFHFLAGSAGAKTMTIDYVRAIQVGRN